MIHPNHPAVEAAARVMHQIQNELDDLDTRWEEEHPTTRDNWCDNALDILDAALDHLTTDDLRNTPAGRELMAEAWEEGAHFAQLGRVYNNSNPYLEADA